VGVVGEAFAQHGEVHGVRLDLHDLGVGELLAQDPGDTAAAGADLEDPADA
jgi:hypothetical protein